MNSTRDLIKRIQQLLEGDKKRTQHHLKTIARDDPFADPERLNDNAASDTEAKEEEGHDRVDAIKRELRRKLSQIERALSRLKIGRYGVCERCGKKIDEGRLKVMPTATLCISCEQKKEGIQ